MDIKHTSIYDSQKNLSSFYNLTETVTYIVRIIFSSSEVKIPNFEDAGVLTIFVTPIRLTKNTTLLHCNLKLNKQSTENTIDNYNYYT